MPTDTEGTDSNAEPDYVMLANADLRDGGPRYTETPGDPYDPTAPLVAEPWNAVSAMLFVVLAVAWLIRLRGRYREYPFLSVCLPILLVGGIGGTLYHGTRTRKLFLYLDVFPIQILGLAGAVFLALRLWGRRGWAYLAGAVVVYVLMSSLLFQLVLPSNRQLAISLNYASLASVILLPMGLLLMRTSFRHAGWAIAGLIGFAIAWFFRVADGSIQPYLPMGSHWVWHTFGAIATGLIIEFFYLVETDHQRPERPE